MEETRARPQVLLLGNGVNRAFGGGSWGQLIRDISCNGSLPEDCVLHLPMPLRAILVTGDTVGVQLRQVKEILYGKLGDPGHVDMLRRLLEVEKYVQTCGPEELKEHPRTGTGHPEQLSGDRTGQWSRRITKKHRLVYEIHDTEVIVLVLTAYGHYDDR